MQKARPLCLILPQHDCVQQLWTSRPYCCRVQFKHDCAGTARSMGTWQESAGMIQSATYAGNLATSSGTAQVLCSLPMILARFCSNCYKAGHMATDCTNKKACNNCHEPGHRTRDCVNEPICNVCSMSGHVARNCHKSGLQSQTGSMFGVIKCQNCGQSGHSTLDCVLVAICNNCGGRGHEAYVCPSAPLVECWPRRY